MRLIIDTHLHFYPCFDLNRALETLRKNLAMLDRNAVSVGILTEGADFNYFNQMYKNPDQYFNAKQNISPLEGALLLTEPGFPDLFLFPGRQIITKERIEILCLLVDVNIDDGLPVQEVIDRIRQQRGVPVLSWAPGKWFFKRGKLIEKLISSNKPASLLLGDTTLRPYGWPKPNIMKRAMKKGFGVVFGSDPLPFSGEERVMGRYATVVNCEFDSNDPVESLRSCLLQPGLNPTMTGKRTGIFSVLYRLFKHAQSKTNSGSNI